MNQIVIKNKSNKKIDLAQLKDEIFKLSLIGSDVAMMLPEGFNLNETHKELLQGLLDKHTPQKTKVVSVSYLSYLACLPATLAVKIIEHAWASQFLATSIPVKGTTFTIGEATAFTVILAMLIEASTDEETQLKEVFQDQFN